MDVNTVVAAVAAFAGGYVGARRDVAELRRAVEELRAEVSGRVARLERYRSRLVRLLRRAEP